MARKNAIPEELDLDELEKQLEELDLGDDVSLELDEGDLVLEEEDLQDVDEEELEVYGSDETGTITLDDGTEVDLTEKGLSKLKKGQIKEAFAKLGFEPVKPTAKKEVLISELLSYLAEEESSNQAVDVGEEFEGLELEEEEVETPLSNKPQTSPKNDEEIRSKSQAELGPAYDFYGIEEELKGEGKNAIILGLRRRASKIVDSDLSNEAKEAALKELRVAEQLISLLL